MKARALRVGPQLGRWLEANGVDAGWYAAQAAAFAEAPRFVRLSALPPLIWPRPGPEAGLAAAAAAAREARARSRAFLAANGGRRLQGGAEEPQEQQHALAPEEVWSVPQSRTLSQHVGYRCGVMQGVDLASVAAVEALGCEPGMSVLDLCCAPGAKLGLLADRLRRSGCLVGADSSASRLDVCAGLARRLRWAAPQPTSAPGDWRFALLLADGADQRHSLEAAAVRWNTAMDGVAFRECAAGAGEADPLQLAAPARPRAGRPRVRARLARDTHFPAAFHRVLVDAQCTTDASFRHVLRHYGDEQVWTETTIEALFQQWMDEREGLQAVQRGLIRRGFGALAPGGKMLYATCSFAPAQNEEIVQWLLAHEPAAKLLPLPPPCAIKRRRDSPRLPLSAYMDPITSASSGLFMALVQKA